MTLAAVGAPQVAATNAGIGRGSIWDAVQRAGGATNRAEWKEEDKLPSGGPARLAREMRRRIIALPEYKLWPPRPFGLDDA